MTEIKVIEPIQNGLQNFKSPEEFNIFFNKNKEELNKMTTCRLNKQYSIDGYKITKIKGEICLKKNVTKTSNEDIELEINEMKNRIGELENKIKKLCDSMNEIIERINSGH